MLSFKPINKLFYKLTSHTFKKVRAFTLIELLIVIGILSILATVVLLVINPAQMIKQSRDGNRLAEINQINKALLLFQSFGGDNANMGTHSKVYVSIPSSQADCSDLSLPALGGGYTYVCSNSTNYRNINGTGWIPVDFTSIQSQAGTLFSGLPIDPINTVANGLYYTYIPGSWALSATMESDKYLASNAATDGGQVSNRFEVGNEIVLNTNLNTPAFSGIAAGGGTCSILNTSGYNTCIFNSSGTLEFNSSGNVEVLVIGGGASGGSRIGGGGGAGGYQYRASYAVTAQVYNVTVGAGGTAITGLGGVGTPGDDGDSSVFGDITAIGGGGGGVYSTPPNGRDGGSGGGAAGYTAGTGGIGSQGSNGGVGGNAASGGGGGAGAIGGNGVSGVGGNGGVGISNSISGSSVYYCGGGGGSGDSAAGTGGIGGGGAGAFGSNSPATSGTANTGGGGGGVRDTSDAGLVSGAGGSGIVIVRYSL